MHMQQHQKLLTAQATHLPVYTSVADTHPFLHLPSTLLHVKGLHANLVDSQGRQHSQVHHRAVISSMLPGTIFSLSSFSDSKGADARHSRGRVHGCVAAAS